MMRRTLLVLSAIVCASCGDVRTCREGSLLIAFDYSGALGADQVEVQVSADDGDHLDVTRPVSESSGTLEVTFESGYPVGQQVDIVAIALRNGARFADAHALRRPGAGCTRVDLTFVPIALDGGSDLRASIDLAVGDSTLDGGSDLRAPIDLAVRDNTLDSAIDLAVTDLSHVVAVCGNGVVEPGEECDDANLDNHDACLNNCRKAKCGDLVVWIGHEVCDDGNTVDDGNGCSADCKTNTHCGNGTLETNLGEVCDDGNNVSGDGCSQDCLSNETCGNGYVDVSKGEACDDGNTTDDGNGCSADCKTNTHCGNGIVEPSLGEVCDDGNHTNGDGCSHDWLSTDVCGTGYVDAARGETCDDGNNDNGDGCPSTCLVAFCGDGFVERGVEQCDDHNSDNTDSCVACKTAFCGDGFIHTGVEQCDDHNFVSNDGCNSSCNKEAGFNCPTPAGPQGPSVCTSICGDGLKVGTEACDDHNALACGTCNATCTASQPAAAAHGTIFPVAGNNLRDGETFTIGDGTTTVVFEFDVQIDNKGTGAGVQPTHVAVAVRGTGAPGGADSQLQIATKMVTAINGVAGFAVTATLSGSSVFLANNFVGGGGNVAMSETVLNNGFQVSGMTGGAGADCNSGDGCASNVDCASWVCTGHICQAPTCSDSVQNEGESDVDCGGTSPCPRCGIGRSCAFNTDCASNGCDTAATHQCVAAFVLTATSPTNGKITAPAGVGSGLNCGATCSDSYNPDTMVTLTAFPNAGFVVSSWGGDCASAGSATTCQVTMSQARNVSVTFSQTFVLTATTPINGAITAPAGVGTGLNCGSTCSDSYNVGTVVTMTAVPNAGHVVSSWGGDCASAGSATMCQVTMSQARNVSVAFSP